jgi:hypothetical protein
LIFCGEERTFGGCGYTTKKAKHVFGSKNIFADLADEGI